MLESQNDLALFIRTNEDKLLASGFATYDFNDMYTTLSHKVIVKPTKQALKEAWEYQAIKSETPRRCTVRDVWSREEGWTLQQITDEVELISDLSSTKASQGNKFKAYQ